MVESPSIAIRLHSPWYRRTVPVRAWSALDLAAVALADLQTGVVLAPSCCPRCAPEAASEIEAVSGVECEGSHRGLLGLLNSMVSEVCSVGVRRGSTFCAVFEHESSELPQGLDVRHGSTFFFLTAGASL